MCVFSRANATPSSASTTSAVTATASSANSSNTSSASGSTTSTAGLMERATSVVSQAQAHLHEDTTPAAQEVAEIEHFAEQLVGHMAKDHHESSQNATNHSDHTTFHPISGGLQVKYI